VYRLVTHHVLTLPPNLRYVLLNIHVLLLGDFVPHHHLLILVAYLHHDHLDLCLLVRGNKDGKLWAVGVALVCMHAAGNLTGLMCVHML